MKLFEIEVKSWDYETKKAFLVNKSEDNKGIWIPKSAIIKNNDNSVVIKAFVLKNETINRKEVKLIDLIDIKKLKALDILINSNEVDFFPENAMKHQEEVFNHAKGLKCCALFMDMGTGKSKLYIDLANYHYKAKNINKVIYFAPPTTLYNFKNELIKWQKTDLEWDILSIHYLSKKEFSKEASNLLTEINEKTMVVIDESHRIKNISSLMSRLAFKIGFKTNYKIIGTGTPSANSPEDLIGQFRFLTPQEFNMSENQLKKTYYKIGEKGVSFGSKNELKILEKTLPYSFSVKKEDCLGLQEKIYNKVEVESKELIKHYKNHLEEVTSQFMSKSSLMGFLQNLRKISTGRNLKNEICIKSPKINILKDIVEDIFYKTIIWHNFYNEIDDILEAIPKNSYVLLNGDMSKEEKVFALDQFKNKEDIKYLVATESVGGTGLNITEASVNIYFSNSFSLTDRLQSEDRTHRLGQERQCMYYDIILKNTIEEKIMDSLKRKEDFLNEIKSIYKNQGKEELIRKIVR